MRVQFAPNEKDIIQSLTALLPEGTTLLEQDEELLFSYEIQNGQLVMVKDFKDHDRKDFRENEGLPEITKEFLVDWWMNVYSAETSPDIPYRYFHLYSNELHNFFSYVWLGGGYYVETGQEIVSVRCNRKADAQAIVDEINDFLPFIKPQNGKKVIKLFEHTLSEHGIYSLHADNETIELVIMAYGKERTLQTFTNWLDAIKYCQLYHYYGNDDDYEDYED